MEKMSITLLVTVLVCFMISCGGSHFKMTTTHTEKAASDKPFRDTLVIVVVDDYEIRSIFENHFKKWLTAKGVEAIASSDVLSVQKGVKLEKEAIVEIVETHGNESVLITRLVRLSDTEVFSRSQPRVYSDYYGFYNHSWEYVHWPTVSKDKLKLTIETRLYDVSTASLIWSGESQLTNPKTPGKAIGRVVEAVMTELEKSRLLPRTS